MPKPLPPRPMAPPELNAGVYVIRSMSSGAVYVGATRDLRRRLVDHRSALRRGVHPNMALRREWERTGGEGFSFEVVERGVALAELGERETWWMDQLGAHDSVIGCNSQPGGMSLRPRRSAVVAGRMRMDALAEALRVTARNITTIVDGLEGEGLLVRKPDPTDQRDTLLELTEKGRAHIAQIHALQCDLAERMFAPLNAEERCVLLALLTRLAQHVSQVSQVAAPATNGHDATQLPLASRGEGAGG